MTHPWITGITEDREVFRVLADTILPAVEGPGPAWNEGGGSLGLENELDELLKRIPHRRAQRELLLLLRMLRTPLGGLALYGSPRRFTRMSPQHREVAFRRMSLHPLGLIRAGARVLKTLLATLWVTTEDPRHPPAAWGAIGYPGPDGPPPSVPKELPVLNVSSGDRLSCEVVVVGSGAGGGVAAAVLAGAGLDVLVVEAGRYHNQSDFTHLERRAYSDMYLDRAFGTTADKGMVILAGATLGGGTVINYTTSLPPPTAVREEWDRVSGLGGVFTGEEYELSLDSVGQRLSVNRDHGRPSARDELMEKGLRELGWHVGEMPRNAVGCTEEACGYCTMGCRIGAKQSTLATYLPDAVANGARIAPECPVDRVLLEGNRVRGVVIKVGEGEAVIEADVVVLAAGALHTPAILMRSGAGGPAVGRYLRLHPVTAVWARFEERVNPWTGILQSRYSDQFADLDGEGYGFRFETAPVHPLFPSAFLGWENGASFKRDVLGLGHLDVAGILLRDRESGRVELRMDGSPQWRYAISKYDQAHVREGVRRAAELYAAAGAEEIISSTVRPVRWRPDGVADPTPFVDAVDEVGYGPNRTTYFTFHQMGTARMGLDPSTSVVDADNRVHGVDGLFVMDGSCFPTASGVNPMLSIAAIAHRGATRLASSLS